MATIRSVLQHSVSKKWAYIEWSDEEKGIEQILGGREFETKEEAVEYAKGFGSFGYVWQDPKDEKRARLIAEKEKLQAKLDAIELQLS